MIAIVELHVPKLPAAMEASLYRRKNLEAMFCLVIAEHLEISDEQVREVKFANTTVQILLSEPEGQQSNKGFNLEMTAKALIGWIKNSGERFTVFDFTFPPVMAAREVYPASAIRYIRRRSAGNDLVSMTLSKRESMEKTQWNSTTNVFQMSPLEQITTQKINLDNYGEGRGNYIVDEIRSLLPSFNIEEIKVSHESPCTNKAKTLLLVSIDNVMPDRSR